MAGHARDDLACRVATIHAQLWVADDSTEETRAALGVAVDALGVLVDDIGDDGLATELAAARAFAASQLAATIDLCEKPVAADGDDRLLRCGRARVEAHLSELLLGLLPSDPRPR